MLVPVETTVVDVVVLVPPVVLEEYCVPVVGNELKECVLVGGWWLENGMHGGNGVAAQSGP